MSEKPHLSPNNYTLFAHCCNAKCKKKSPLWRGHFQGEAGTKAMFARERRSRERFNYCLYDNIEMPTGSFFNED